MNGRRFGWIRLLLQVVLLACLLLGFGPWSAAPVSAHALLLRSSPEANALLPSAPIQIELVFSEALEFRLSSIRVLDAAAQPVDQGDVKVDPDNPTRMTVNLRSLGDGVFTVSWKAVSSADGHLTSGAFPFAVGNENSAALAASAPSTSHIPLSPAGVLAKWLFILCVMVLAGLAPFRTLVWEPVLRGEHLDSEIDQGIGAGWVFLQNLALTGAFVALAWDLLVQAGQGSALEMALPWASETARLLLETRWGLIWLLRMDLLLVLTALAWSKSAPWKNWAAFVVCLSLLLAVSLTSHAAADAHPLIPFLLDWLHLSALSVWIGGLAYFVRGMWLLRRAEGNFLTRATSRLIVHFSALALGCVGVLAVTGTFTALMRVDSIASLLNTLYGRVLLAKLALAAVLILMGAYNLLVISPRLRRARSGDRIDLGLVNRFRMVITAEIGLAALVLVSASLLSSLPPARSGGASGELSGSQQVDDLRIDLNISPGWVGLNTFTLQLEAGGQPLQSAREVLLRFTAGKTGLPPSELQLLGQEGGTFSAKGSNLSLPEDWQVQVIVRREVKFDAYANFDFTVQGKSSPAPAVGASQMAGALVVLAGLGLFAAALLQVRFLPLSRPVGSVGALLLVLCGSVFLLHPAPNPTSTANPIPPNPQSVAAGRQLYQRDCLACHGPAGKGDGPVGMNLIPPPADLSLHAVPGVHTDAQLFDWISAGVPGSRMPAFQTHLNETERWNLVNFIRSLAPLE